MVAYEQFKKFTYKEIIIFVLISFICSAVMYIGVSKTNPTVAMLISLAISIVGMNLAVYLSEKSGSALIMYVLFGILTSTLNDIGVTGWEKVIVYFCAGLVFEIVFLILKIKIHSIPLDMILGTTISTISIILFSSISLTSGLLPEFPIELGNVMILGLCVAVFFSTLTFLIWYSVSTTKLILKFKNYISY
jgi:ABC-type thiamin/hydroxymethylpyrimidine transport system permease subunit